MTTAHAATSPAGGYTCVVTGDHEDGEAATLGMIEQASSAAMATPLLRLSTDRLELRPLTADALDALTLRDRERLEALTDAHFPHPLLSPPLTDDALPFFRDQVRAAAGALGASLWLIMG